MRVLRYTLYAIPLFVFLLSGCIVRTYSLTRERVDQDLDQGNRGYLQGEASAGEVKTRQTSRTTQIVEVELHSPIKFERIPQPKPVETMPLVRTEDEELWGNRGYITQSETPQILEPGSSLAESAFEKYTVKIGDSLQKISKKIYGTSRKWAKIYEANKDKLKSPNKVYPGQILDIPSEQKFESLKEIKGNLK